MQEKTHIRLQLKGPRKVSVKHTVLSLTEHPEKPSTVIYFSHFWPFLAFCKDPTGNMQAQNSKFSFFFLVKGGG